MLSISSVVKWDSNSVDLFGLGFLFFGLGFLKSNNKVALINY